MASAEAHDRPSKRVRDDVHASIATRNEVGSDLPGESGSRRHREGRFRCTYDGCGKSYSRQEHLSRHQLNHTPKEIFRCDFRDCTRTFVRQDLCARHAERHAIQERPTRDVNPETKSPAASDIGADLFPNNSDGVHAPVQSSSNDEYPTNQHFPITLHSIGSLEPADVRASGNGFTDPGQQQPADATNADHRYSFADHDLQLGDSLIGLNEQASTASNTSPSGIGADFAAWLFNEPGNAHNNVFPIGVQTTLGMTNFWDGFGEDYATDTFASTSLPPTFPDLFQQNLLAPRARPEILVGNALLSAEKRGRLIDIMQQRFNEAENFGESKSVVLGGNRDAEEHALSMHSMQLYIGSYWYHFHAQMPILHRPTFSADNTHDYLLLAVMVIGASCLDRIHGRAITDSAAKLANFISWHLRWQIYMHADFQPPAKLWIFQTLLLLEVYEKMNATKALHERAHIHFATTLTLMRRGSSLVGKSSGTATPILSDYPHHSVSGLHLPPRQINSIAPDAYWERWITAEATRRVTFAAFLLDATHSTMFGHAAIMVVHEIRLPLPCDDALWSATSSAEVGRVEASLHANGIKPITFLEGLKTILNSHKVRTNSFGRMILMAGLMSVTWHMRQRDLQSSSLGVRQALGVPDGWRSPLNRSFDFWKKDFDESLAHMRSGTLSWQRASGGVDEALIAEALCTVMYHLSHMAMNMDLADCQIFAGGRRWQGRTITQTDYQSVKGRMSAWATSHRGREAAFHAFQFVIKVLISEPTPPDLNGCSDEDINRCLYDARDDPLFNRPWVLYYATLVLWSYGMALEGPLRPFPSHLVYSSDDCTTLDAEQTRAMFQDAMPYLRGPLGKAKSPSELQRVAAGKNRIVGVIGLVRRSFEGSRWELLQEASERLGGALDMLRG